MTYLDIGGDVYIIDFAAIEDLLEAEYQDDDKKQESSETQTKYDGGGNIVDSIVTHHKGAPGKEYDLVKLEFLRYIFEVVIANNEIIDDTLGFTNAMKETSAAFRVSFNTLLSYGIIKLI